MLRDVKPTKVGSYETLINNQVPKGKNYIIKKNKDVADKIKIENDEKTLLRVRTILQRLPWLVFSIKDKQLTSCKIILEHVDDVEFADFVGIEKRIFKAMIEKNVVNSHHDRCLLQYATELDS
jgi:hypothetical protein